MTTSTIGAPPKVLPKNTRSTRDYTPILILCGANHTEKPVRGLRVGEIRRAVAEELNLAEGATALIDHQPATDDAVVGPDAESLEFRRPAGKFG